MIKTRQIKIQIIWLSFSEHLWNKNMNWFPVALQTDFQDAANLTSYCIHMCPYVQV